MKPKIRKSGKGRQRKVAMESLLAMTGERPILQPAYTFWLQLRRQDEVGRGIAFVEERPLVGDGLFWNVSSKDATALFLFSPQRVVATLKKEARCLSR